MGRNEFVNSVEKSLRTSSARVKKSAKFFRDTIPYAGPAFLVSVGYMDPGNWGTDLAAGSQFGYQLLWVLLVSNLMAILLQTMAARLGIVSGHTLAEMCRLQFSRPVNMVLYVAAELAMMATDIAEFLGAAIGFNILFGIPMFPAALLAAGAVVLILALYRFGYRVVEYVIIGFVAVIGLSYVIELAFAHPDLAAALPGTFIPHLPPGSVYVAIGMLGATVMPHNLFLHSGLIQTRGIQGTSDLPHDVSKKRLMRFAAVDSLFALNSAWLVNAAILIMSSAVFFTQGSPIASIQEAHRTLEPLLGGLSAAVFAIALLASGLSSSTTGTIAGQMVLEGFLQVRINLWARRVVTIIPALVVIALGIDEIKVLVFSQVALSLALPFAVIPLIMFTHNDEIMGNHRSPRAIHYLAIASALFILFLNVLLVVEAFGVSI